MSDDFNPASNRHAIDLMRKHSARIDIDDQLASAIARAEAAEEACAEQERYLREAEAMRAALAVALTDANELRVALRKVEEELAEARAEMLKDQRRLSAAEWRRKWWKARAERSEAERDRMTAKITTMHRRAQSSEGKLDRTMAMLRAILKATDPKKYHWVFWWVSAALRHSRSNSGIAGEIAYSFLRKENKVLCATLAVAIAALEECAAEADHSGVVADAALTRIAEMKGGAE